ncbi:MAG: two-component system sensor histidine kinase RpfC [Desulforhopalus sp.]|jgi:two-component system sensor histidine kinase RpfC
MRKGFRSYTTSSKGFRQLVSIWEERPDLEHQQALLRVAVGFVVFGYLLYTMLLDGNLSIKDQYILLTSGVFFVTAFIILAWLAISPGISVPRRLLGIVVDNGATTAALYFHGILGVPLFILYLWVSFGNGFRFGKKYLFFSALLGLLGFSIVTQFSDNYETNSSVTLGLFVGLIVLPLYVASLLGQLTRSLELAETANRAKSNFLATMSHEIRTPLNGMVGVTEILDRTNLSSQQRHYVSLISRSSEWLMRVITDGLDFSKIEAGEFLLSEETFDLSLALTQFCALYEGIQKNKDVQFLSNIDSNIPDLVMGDQLRLNQVLSNLVSNSLKFTTKGEVHFKAKVILKKRDGVRIQFTVTDTGPGVALDKQKEIFEPFRQVDSGIAKKYGGTGLGLAIAARIVVLMGGKLTLASTLGEGASFSFNLFFSDPSEEEARAVEKDLKNNSLTLGWKRQPQLLVVEDHEINREVIAHQLQNMDCAVALAVNGSEALEYLKYNMADLVLMDYQMPLMDGYTATRLIRENEGREGRGHRMPIVALTAHVTVDDRRKCLESGMDDYLGKPFTSELLRKKLYRWLQPLLSDQINNIEPIVADVYEEEGREEYRVDTRSERGESEKLLHDLKNMLLAIYGSTELALMKSEDSDGQKRHMERIYVAVQEANQIVETLTKKCTEKK